MDLQKILDQVSQFKTNYIIDSQFSQTNIDNFSIQPPVVLNITNYDYWGCSLELGGYFLLSSICMFCLLNQVNGKVYRLNDWLVFRRFDSFKVSKLRQKKCVRYYLAFPTYFFLITPILILIAWSMLILWDNYVKININTPYLIFTSILPSLCILCIGTSLLLTVFSFLNIAWKKYKTKYDQIAAICFSILFLGAYQSLIIFGYKHASVFIPYTAFFLCYNVIFLAMFVFISKYSQAESDVFHLIRKYFPKKYEKLQLDQSDENWEQEIINQDNDKTWLPYYEDLTDIVTISSVNAESESLFSGGLLSNFGKSSIYFKALIYVTLLGASVLMLAIYSFVYWWTKNNSYLGIVISISITCMDAFNFCIYFASLINTPGDIVFLLVLNRVILIAFGEGYWVYGFMILYLFYALFFVFLIARISFPFEYDILIKQQQINNYLKANEIKRTTFTVSQAEKFLNQWYKNPKLLLFILSGMYVGYMFAVQYIYDIKLQGVEIHLLALMPGTIYQKQILFWHIALFSIFLIFSIYFFISTIRIAVRQAKTLQRFRPKYDCTFIRDKYFCTVLGVYMIFTWVCCIGWSYIGFWISYDFNVLVWGCVSPIVLLFSLNSYVYFAKNDFQYLQKLNLQNIYVDKHNANIDELEKNRKNIQDQMLEGKIQIQVYTDNQIGLVSQEQQQDQDSLLFLISELRENQEIEANEYKKIIDSISLQRKLHLQKEFDEIQMQYKIRNQKNNEYDRLLDTKKLRLFKKTQSTVFDQYTIQRNRVLNKGNSEQTPLVQQNRKNSQPKTYDGYSDQSKIDPDPIVNEIMIENNKIMASDQSAFINDEDANPSNQRENDPNTQNNSNYDASNYKANKQIPKECFIDFYQAYIDYEAEMEKEDGLTKIASNKLKWRSDWRLSQKSCKCCQAFFCCKLQSNDYKFIVYLILSLTFYALLVLLLCLLNNSYDGVIYCLPYLYIQISILIFTPIIYQNRSFSASEVIVIIFLNIVYILLGCGYFQLKSGFQNVKYDIYNRDAAQEKSSIFLYFYVLFVPTFSFGIALALKIADRGLSGFDCAFKFILSGFVLGIILMIILSFFFVQWVIGVIFIGAVLTFIYISAQIYMYIANENQCKNMFWLIVNSILALACILCSSVWAIFDIRVGTFTGITVSVAVAIIFIWFYTMLDMIKDINELETNPIYCATHFLPIFKYNQKKFELEEHNGPIVCILCSLSVIILWGLFANLQITPVWFGALVSIVVELSIIIVIIHSISVSKESIRVASLYIDQNTAKKAWISSKLQYIKKKGVVSRKDIKNYKNEWINREQLIEYINWFKQTLQNTEKKRKKVSEDVNQKIEDSYFEQKRVYTEKLKKFWPQGKNFEDLDDLNFVKFQQNTQLDEYYTEEIYLFIKMIMFAVQNATVTTQLKQQGIIKFIEMKQALLNAIGINIYVPKVGTISQIYTLIQYQLDQYQDIQLTFFWKLREIFVVEEEEKLKKSKIASKEQKIIHINRNQEMQQFKLEKEKQIQEMRSQYQRNKVDLSRDLVNNVNIDVNEMPDCLEKYQIILERSRQANGGNFKGDDGNTNAKFYDRQFPPTNESIGQSVLQNRIGSDSEYFKWKRLSDLGPKKYKIFALTENQKDVVDARDVIQGSLGNCFFVSSLAVLGSKYTQERFYFKDQNGFDEWLECGAFCVKFFDDLGNEECVIVDDYFYVDESQDNKLVFGHSSNENELWVSIIEKAYAKKNISYSQLDLGGFIHYALKDLSNGIPMKMTKVENQNLPKWWGQLITYYKQGYLLGAGSPDDPQGDTATSENGIHKRHAYSILKLVEFDNQKLICLRNPHGRNEWTGKWSDNSQQWTQRAINIIKDYTYMDEEDGIFWMEFMDFIDEFEDVYVCKNLTAYQGWQQDSVEGKWVDGETAIGLPTQDNPTPQIEKNPQYQITINSPCQAVLVLRLIEKDEEKPLKMQAAQSCYVELQANSGKLILRKDLKNTKKIIAKIGPTRKLVDHIPFTFPSNMNYPQTFTLICASTKSGQAGEGNFKLELFTNNSNSKSCCGNRASLKVEFQPFGQKLVNKNHNVQVKRKQCCVC